MAALSYCDIEFKSITEKHPEVRIMSRHIYWCFLLMNARHILAIFCIKKALQYIYEFNTLFVLKGTSLLLAILVLKFIQVNFTSLGCALKLLDEWHKQSRPWSDATFFSAWTGSTLFAHTSVLIHKIIAVYSDQVTWSLTDLLWVTQ